MPLDFPENRQVVVDRMQADVRAQFGLIDFLPESFFLSLIIAGGARHFETYEQLEAALKTAFPNTATGIFLDLWFALKGVTRQASSQANGEINVTGTIGTQIPKDEVLTSAGGEEYKISDDATISEIILIPTSLTRSASTATLTFSVPHSISSGIEGVVGGANEVEYNGTFTLNAQSDTELTYTITGTPATPATGTITLTVELASAPVISIDYGSDVNVPSGTHLTFQSPISGVDDIALVQFGGIRGGNDQESDESYRKRGLLTFSHPVANFNEAQVSQIILLVPEVTREWVFPETPQPGLFEVYFVLDERDYIFPTVDDIDRAITELNKTRPVNIIVDNTMVKSPIPVPVDFIFTSLSPLTTSMQNAVEENLKAFFFDQSNVGVDIKKKAYDSAIYSTIDPSTGQQVEDSTLTSPVGDITVTAGELAYFNSINWSI